MKKVLFLKGLKYKCGSLNILSPNMEVCNIKISLWVFEPKYTIEDKWCRRLDDISPN
jgi:hypothetical protein